MIEYIRIWNVKFYCSSSDCTSQKIMWHFFRGTPQYTCHAIYHMQYDHNGLIYTIHTHTYCHLLCKKKRTCAWATTDRYGSLHSFDECYKFFLCCVLFSSIWCIKCTIRTPIHTLYAVTVYFFGTHLLYSCVGI